MTMMIRRMALVLVLLACGACMKQEPVKIYVVHAAGGGTITEADETQMRATLDAFATRHKMEKVKSGELDVIRYYQPTATYEIGFYAVRSKNKTRIIVYANPLSTGVSRRESYKAFRQNLANALTQAFPGRVSMEVPK